MAIAPLSSALVPYGSTNRREHDGHRSPRVGLAYFCPICGIPLERFDFDKASEDLLLPVLLLAAATLTGCGSRRVGEPGLGGASDEHAHLRFTTEGTTGRDVS